MPPNDAEEAAKLVHMANQIAAFFRPYPEADAVTAVRGHLADFWTQHMREKLRAAGPDGLDPLVVRALAPPAPAQGGVPASAA